MKSYGEILKIFKKVLKTPSNKINIVLHSFDASKEITESMLKLNANFYFSLNLNSLKSLSDILEYISIDKIILESDSPWLINKEVLLI